jgi:hypothetical protein
MRLKTDLDNPFDTDAGHELVLPSFFTDADDLAVLSSAKDTNPQQHNPVNNIEMKLLFNMTIPL